jgi:hypothetical protein
MHAMPNPLASPTTSTPSAYDPASDVQNRVKKIASQDSLLNQMAQTEAAKMMNRRGMLNSSMFVGAAQDAVLRQAVPIASQESNQAFQSHESELDRISREGMQEKDIAFRTGEGALDRALQEKLASWNLKSSDRNAAAQFITNMETMYQSSYQSIMNNPNLDAAQRTAQLNAAKQMRDRQLSFVEQMYNIDLDWGQTGSPSGPLSFADWSAKNKPVDGWYSIPGVGDGKTKNAQHAYDIYKKTFDSAGTPTPATPKPKKRFGG